MFVRIQHLFNKALTTIFFEKDKNNTKRMLFETVVILRFQDKTQEKMIYSATNSKLVHAILMLYNKMVKFKNNIKVHSWMLPQHIAYL